MDFATRYDIAFADFEDNYGLVEFLDTTAKVMKTTADKIAIKSVKPGSVIIDAGVQVTAAGTDDASIAAAKAQAIAMNSAMQNADLSIMGVPVLGFSSQVAEPVVTGTSSSSKKNVGLIVGLTIGLIALAAGLAGAGWFFYKKSKANSGNPNVKTGGYSNVAVSPTPVGKNEDMERILSTTPVGLKSEGAGSPSS